MGDTIPHPDADEIDRVANLLIAEWCRVEKIALPSAPLSDGSERLNISYVANFADMARVVIADRRARYPEATDAELADACAKAIAITDWDAADSDSRDEDEMYVCVECNARYRCDFELKPSPLCNLCAHACVSMLARVVARLHAENAAFNAAIGSLDESNRNLTERRDALLQMVAELSQSVPLDEEIKGAIEARGKLLAEVGTLRSRVAELERELADREAAGWKAPEQNRVKLGKKRRR